MSSGTTEGFEDFLSKNNLIRENLDVEFLFEELSGQLTRRQAMILRLLLLEKHTQAQIGEKLGYSGATISLELKKIKEIIRKALKDRNK